MDLARLNWSTLKHIAVSPALMRWRIEHPMEDTPALKFGRALHCLVLEPSKFDSRWVVASPCAAVKKNGGGACGSTGSLFLAGSWYCKVRGHAPEGAGALPDGIESITSTDRETAKICANRIAAHDIAADTLRGGHAEEPLEWDDPITHLACRGRLDFLRADYVADLKTTCTETSREFIADAARRLYHGQLAWYHDGAIRAGRLSKAAPMPRIVTVETGEPYDVAVYEMPPLVLEAGRLLYRDLLRRYVECQAAQWRPGHSPDLQYLDLPKWAEGMQAAVTRGDW